MSPESQQKILRVVSQILKEVSNALEMEFSYEKAINWLREYGNKTVSEVLLVIAQKWLATEGDHDITPGNVDAYLAAIDTWQKAEVILLAIPEPDTRQLDSIVSSVKAALPTLRQILLPFAKRLPHPPGGRPTKLSDPLKRVAVREEIGKLLADGVDLTVAKKRLADREGVSFSTIDRIWSGRKKT